MADGIAVHWGLSGETVTKTPAGMTTAIIGIRIRTIQTLSILMAGIWEGKGKKDGGYGMFPRHRL